MEIPITTNIEKFYKQLMGVLSVYAPLNKLCSRELNVLIEFMILNYKFRDVPENVRSVVMFSKEEKEGICKRLKLTMNAFNNYLSLIRKKGLLSKDNKLPKFLNIIPENNEYIFKIVFKIKE